ncbi:fatty acyl-CoA reductase 1-like isoform X2 [Varroa jacobsoni]|uniref:Fatty acyl-CoA reductase n=1 Tax=Varroa destructor TaxID=109461 RepID=A0A7M7J9B2_VARDE|nr:fatty acyl-CoA reductase 1-like isoform X2 [Varroa destructor]XP_022692465.1 fatty acyl-CoA reductase 1-like isoform X2 [Varroa jacobsoni]
MANRKMAVAGTSNGTATEAPIQSFFCGKSALVTGASGFLGKVLVEKLLRSCHGLDNIYCLIRSKDSESPQQRLEKVLEAPIFEQTRKCGILSKVVAIEGDILADGLGLSEENRKTLVERVSIVFHSAASVRFDEPLRKAIDINVLGTRRVLELCRDLKSCAAFVHVSTAYCFCNRNYVGEEVYDEKIHYQKVIDASEWMDDETAKNCLSVIMDNRPSTYHYTKALAERLLVEEGRGIPIVILRPSIVTAAWREPLAGWVDNFNGPAGFVIATGKGVLRTMYIRPDSVADVYPVDLVTRMMVASAWYCSQKKFVSPYVINCTTGPLHQLTWRQIFEYSKPIVLANPSMEIFRYPGGSFKESKFWNRIAMALDHSLPAFIADSFAVMFGRKPILGEVYGKIHRAMHILEYFTTHEWEFSIDNVHNLLDHIKHPKDREDFDFDIRPMDWLSFLEQYILGVRKYVLKEDPSTIPAARAKLNSKGGSKCHDISTSKRKPVGSEKYPEKRGPSWTDLTSQAAKGEKAEGRSYAMVTVVSICKK